MPIVYPELSSTTDGKKDNIINYNVAVKEALDYVASGASTDLSTALGSAPTPVTRTNNPIVGTNSPNANIDKLDAAIGADASIHGSAKNISAANTIYQNLDSLDIYKTVRTVKKTIGAVGFPGCDFAFTTADDQVEQVINLGAIIPAKARILDAMIVNDAVFTNAVSLVAELGTSSSGHELINSATVYAGGAINAMAADHHFTIAPVGTATSVYLAATPGANWSLCTAGSLSVYISFIDLTNV